MNTAIKILLIIAGVIILGALAFVIIIYQGLQT